MTNRESPGGQTEALPDTLPAWSGSRQYIAAVGRRGDAAQRLSVLFCPECRSTYADPWTHTCGLIADPPSAAAVDGWASTLGVLLDVGVTPVVPAAVARELWRRGGAERELVDTVRARGGVIG